MYIFEYGGGACDECRKFCLEFNRGSIQTKHCLQTSSKYRGNVLGENSLWEACNCIVRGCLP